MFDADQESARLPSKLNNVLLPTFGGPKIGRLIPERRISPRQLSRRCNRISFTSFSTIDLAKIARREHEA